MNELLINAETLTFNTDIIKQSGLIRAKYKTWSEPRNGLVTFVKPDTLQVLFQTGVNASTSYYRIKAAEVRDGKWDLIYTDNFENVWRTDLNDGND